MTDIRTLLHEAAGPTTATTPADVHADLTRGHRALRRHRVKTVGVRGGLAAGLALGAVVATTNGAGPTSAPAGPSAAPSASAAPSVSLQGTTLVAYTGAQPEGYIIAKVPKGYTVTGSTPSSLTLSPAGATDSSPHLFVDKIAIAQQADGGPGEGAAAVTVNGEPASLDTLGDGSRILYIKQENGSNLSVQVWEGLKLSDEQLVELASGITVTDEATLTYG